VLYNRLVGQSVRVSDDIERADSVLDDVVSEAWERRTDEPDIRSVDAGYLRPYGQWQVGVAVMEFVREGDAPYEGLRRAIEAALGSVAGATGVAREDTETWLVSGSPSGMELVAAVARVLDERAGELRAWYEHLA
jgi:hypothetical protein